MDKILFMVEIGGLTKYYMILYDIVIDSKIKNFYKEGIIWLSILSFQLWRKMGLFTAPQARELFS